MAKKKNRELTDILEDMHVKLAEDLLQRIENGTATAADLSVARQFLRDNGIEAQRKNHKPLASLAEKLPFSVGAAVNE